MKIKIEKISDGFTCGSCGQDDYRLAIDASKESNLQICYDCAFKSFREQVLIEQSINKFIKYDRDETYESEIL